MLVGPAPPLPSGWAVSPVPLDSQVERRLQSTQTQQSKPEQVVLKRPSSIAIWCALPLIRHVFNEDPVYTSAMKVVVLQLMPGARQLNPD